MHRRRPHFARGFALIAAVWALGCVDAHSAGPRPVPAPVKSGKIDAVIDGDTVRLVNGSEVRLVGIQAPKLPLGRRGFKAWPLSAEARNFLETLLAGGTVTLEYGGAKIDRHRRLLAHLFLADGRWVQGEILTAGMARVYSFPDNRNRVKGMLAAERMARRNRRGIWSHPFYRIRSPESLSRDIGTFQIIEGVPKNIAIVRGRAYLNFGDNWREDFTITMAPRTIRRFWRNKDIGVHYGEKRLRVRGWLRKFNGPQIVVTHPEQIEVLQ